MSLVEVIFSLPVEVDQWIALFYVALVLGGARIVEFVARKHYERARNFAVQGFEYLEEEDQYRCPEGEHLKLLKQDNENRLAVYQIGTSCHSVGSRNPAHRIATHGRLRVQSSPGPRPRWENSTVASAQLCFSQQRSSAPSSCYCGRASQVRVSS
jgi:hypothetical protein